MWVGPADPEPRVVDIFLHDLQGFGSHGVADIVLTDGVSSVTAGAYATIGLHSDPVWSDASDHTGSE